MLWFLIDLGTFVLSRAAHLAQRLGIQAIRRRRVVRLLRGKPEIAGSVMLVTPIITPLSRRSAAACRLVVERSLEDGTWVTIFDETQIGELQILAGSLLTRLDGPLALVRPEGTRFDGRTVLDAMDQLFSVEEQDLRATEYLLHHGEWVHIFGIALDPDAKAATGSPYRSATPAAYRHDQLPTMVISPWPRAAFLREIHGQPQLLPPW